MTRYVICSKINFHGWMGGCRHGLSSNPSADRFQGQKFLLTRISVLVTRIYLFPQMFRSQCLRICAFFHVWWLDQLKIRLTRPKPSWTGAGANSSCRNYNLYRIKYWRTVHIQRNLWKLSVGSNILCEQGYQDTPLSPGLVISDPPPTNFFPG